MNTKRSLRQLSARPSLAAAREADAEDDQQRAVRLRVGVPPQEAAGRGDEHLGVVPRPPFASERLANCSLFVL